MVNHTNFAAMLWLRWAQGTIKRGPCLPMMLMEIAGLFYCTNWANFKHDIEKRGGGSELNTTMQLGDAALVSDQHVISAKPLKMHV